MAVKNKKQPMLAAALQYLTALDDGGLLAIAIAISANTHNTLIEADENIIAFEVMLYSYRQLLAKTNKTKSNQLSTSTVEYTPKEIEYIGKVRSILVQLAHDPNRIHTMVALLSKIYKEQIGMLEELFNASTTAIAQIINFNIILNSQIITLKNLAKKTGTMQITAALKLEQTAVSKILPILIKKLKHDREIFYSKHRFMAEEFKIFLRERQALLQDSAYGEASAANIYDMLKRMQDDIPREIEFGGYNA